MKLVITAASVILSALSVASFVPAHPVERHFASLAVNAKGNKAKRGGGGGGGSGSGGFGGGEKGKDKPKVRSVSGYTGSGTKPLRIAANTFDEIRKKYEKDPYPKTTESQQ